MKDPKEDLQVIGRKEKKHSAKPQISFGVKGPEELKLKADFLAMAGGFKDPIVRFMRAYLENGGRVRIIAAAEGSGKTTGVAVPDKKPKGSQKRAYNANEFESWHKMLDEILDSGIPEFAHAIIANLEGWSRAAKGTRTDEGKRDAGPRTPGNQAGAAEKLDSVTKRAQAGKKGDPPNEQRSA